MLRKIRLAKGLKLREVAERAETSIQQVQRLENGERKLTTEWIEKLSKALDCEPSDIVPSLATQHDRENLEILDIIKRLPRDERGALLAYLRSRYPTISSDKDELSGADT